MKTSFAKALNFYRDIPKTRYDINTEENLTGTAIRTPSNNQILSLPTIKTLAEIKEILMGKNPPEPVEDPYSPNAEIKQMQEKLKSFSEEFNTAIQKEYKSLFPNKTIEIRLNSDDVGINAYFSVIINGKEIKDDIANEILSSGEFTRLKIFILTRWKKTEEPTYLIIDDIMDSLDDSSRYAVIRLLQEFVHNKKFYLIILTHDFDWYTNLFINFQGSKKVLCYQAIKNEESEIKLIEQDICDNTNTDPIHQIDIFSELTCIYNAEPMQLLLISMSFMRNKLSGTNEDIKRLNEMMHFQAQSPKLNELKDIYIKYFRKTIDDDFKDITIQQVIKSITIPSTSSGQLIKDLGSKLLLSLKIRFMTEEYCTQKNKSKSITKYLSILRENSQPNKDIIDILNDVTIMAPEFIHLNGGAYRSLINIKIEELSDLYTKVSNLK